MRSIGSSHVDPYSALAGAAAALFGPLHGGANEAVLRMLDEIGSKSKVPEFITAVKGGSGRLMGFGHRVYKNYDPRAKLIKRLADDGNVVYTPYKGVELTQKGRKNAIRVLRRHRLWELFLVKVLHYGWDEIHEEAERLEHMTSEKLEERLDAFERKRGRSGG